MTTSRNAALIMEEGSPPDPLDRFDGAFPNTALPGLESAARSKG